MAASSISIAAVSVPQWKGDQHVWSPKLGKVKIGSSVGPSSFGSSSSSILFSRKQNNFGSSSSSILFSRKQNFAVLGTGFAEDDEVWVRRNRRRPWLMMPPCIDKANESMHFFFYVPGSKCGSPPIDLVFTVNNNRPPFLKGCTDDDPFSMNYVGSSHGWLALSYTSSHIPQQFLYNPLTDAYIDLPCTSYLPVPSNEPDYDIFIRKLVLSCPPDADHYDDCIAMISYDYSNRLAFCRLSDRKSAKWTPIGEVKTTLAGVREYREYQDFVYSAKRKLFFCVTQSGELEAWDLRDPHSPPEMTPIDFLKHDENNYPLGSVGKLNECQLKRMFETRSVKHLVTCEQTDQLFLIKRYVADRKPQYGCLADFPYHTVSFDVYEIDIEKRELRYVESSLNGLAMFVGLNHAFSVVNGEEGINPNSIYFTDAKEYTPYHWDVDAKYGGHDIGVFDYAKRSFSPCGYPIEKRTFSTNLRRPPSAASGADEIKRIVPPPMWFYPSCPYNFDDMIRPREISF